jgi:hypothetical protein
MRSLVPLFFAILLSEPVKVCPQELTWRSQTIQPPEMGPLTYLELQYAQEKFTLVPPTDWRTEGDAQAGTIKFRSCTGSLSVALRFTTNSADRTLSSAEALRENVVPHLADATASEMFSAQAGDRAGKGVDLSFSLQGHALRCRAAAVPLRSGCVHFVLMCAAEEFKIGQQTFGRILSSFQGAPPTASTR